MSDKFVPRLSIDITLEQQKRIQDLIPWGLRGPLFAIIVEDMLNLIEEHGEKVIAVVISRKLRPRDLMLKIEEKKHGT
jgi:hypothetical protein